MEIETNEIHNINLDNKELTNELDSYNEMKFVSELKNQNEFVFVKEIPDVRKEKPMLQAKKKGKVNDLTLLKSIVVAVVGLTSLGSAIITTNGVKVREAYVEAYHSEIFYEFEFENYKNETLVIKVYNDFTNREEKVKEHFVSNVVTDLKPNVTYTISVSSNGRKLYSKTITTKEEHSEEYYDSVIDEPVDYSRNPNGENNANDFVNDNNGVNATGRNEDGSMNGGN